MKSLKSHQQENLLKVIMNASNPRQWIARVKSRVKKVLAWIARGSKNTCPT